MSTTVETTGQRDCLLRLGFDAAQGYLFSPALPAHTMRDFLAFRGETRDPLATAGSRSG